MSTPCPHIPPLSPPPLAVASRHTAITHGAVNDFRRFGGTLFQFCGRSAATTPALETEFPRPPDEVGPSSCSSWLRRAAARSCRAPIIVGPNSLGYVPCGPKEYFVSMTPTKNQVKSIPRTVPLDTHRISSRVSEGSLVISHASEGSCMSEECNYRSGGSNVVPSEKFNFRSEIWIFWPSERCNVWICTPRHSAAFWRSVRTQLLQWQSLRTNSSGMHSRCRKGVLLQEQESLLWCHHLIDSFQAVHSFGAVARPLCPPPAPHAGCRGDKRDMELTGEAVTGQQEHGRGYGLSSPNSCPGKFKKCTCYRQSHCPSPNLAVGSRSSLLTS